MTDLRIFAEISLQTFLQSRLDSMRKRVASERENYILNVPEEQYVKHLASIFTLDNIQLLVDKVEASQVSTGIEYHIPFQGDPELLRCAPTSGLEWTRDAWEAEGELSFNVALSSNPNDVNRRADRILNNLKRQSEYVAQEVNEFNARLEERAREVVQQRRDEILKKHNYLDAIKVPLRRREGLPTTFAVPRPKMPNRITVKPQASERTFKPEPTVDEETYRDILKVINDIGKAFERLPATYASKREEDLRDHVLLYLEPRFEGTATGETFNRAGKTDILLRFETTNVFVAEFKFWRGPQALREAAEQLFSYLTWRDSKTALVIFVRNSEFGRVLETSRGTLRTLPNFVRENAPIAESWFDFVFHIPTDGSREIRVAVLLFHLPPPADEEGDSR